MRRSPPKYCYLVLPLDLHVLSLPLAFILSQDQTLHCKNLFLNLFTKTNPVNSIQNTNKLIIWRDFHISPGCLLHNFKELLSSVAFALKDPFFFYFAFGTTKITLQTFLPKKNEIFFPAFLFPCFPFFLQPESLSLLPFNQLFVLKRVQMYEMNFTIQIYLQVFSQIFLFFLYLFCIRLWFKPLIGGRFEE